MKMCWAVILLVGLAGCSGGDQNKAEVSGSVSYDGQPIAQGMIRFIPIEETKGPTSGADIIDGKYRVVNKGGVPLGIHKVTVKAFRKNPNMPEFMAKEGVLEQYIPAKHQKDSQLKVTITQDESTWVQDFDLEK